MILVDTNEPEDIITLLRQVVPVTVLPINLRKMSDYYFGNPQGETFQFSRKQAAEVIGDIDEAEDQIRDYYPNATHNFQIVEGIVSPVKFYGIDVRDHSSPKLTTRDLGGKIFCYRVENNGWIEKGHSFSAVSPAMYYAWIHRLEMAGVPTYNTITAAETAKLLTTIYKNEQKPLEEHFTLQRVIKPRIQIRDADPLMKSLLYLSDAYKLRLGEKKSQAICDRFANLYHILISPVEDLAECEGIGIRTAERIMKALGRSE